MYKLLIIAITLSLIIITEPQIGHTPTEPQIGHTPTEPQIGHTPTEPQTQDTLSIKEIKNSSEATEPQTQDTRTYLGRLQVYGYNYTDAAQCGKKTANGITASGEPAVHGKTCATSSDIPFGTVIYIENLGYFTVNDRGVGRNTVDIAFDNDKDCYAVTGKYEVWIVE